MIHLVAEKTQLPDVGKIHLRLFGLASTKDVTSAENIFLVQSALRFTNLVTAVDQGLAINVTSVAKLSRTPPISRSKKSSFWEETVNFVGNNLQLSHTSGRMQLLNILNNDLIRVDIQKIKL